MKSIGIKRKAKRNGISFGVRVKSTAISRVPGPATYSNCSLSNFNKSGTIFSKERRSIDSKKPIPGPSDYSPE